MKSHGKINFDGKPEVNTSDKLVGVHETTADPVVGDDVNDGYYSGYIWIATTSNKIFICEDATAGAAVWSEVDGAGGSSPLTTKGDLYGFSTVDARLPVGTNNQKIVADSAEALGVKWVTDEGTVNMASTSWANATPLNNADTGLTFVSNEIVIRSLGTGTNDVGIVVNDFIVPSDYKSGGELRLWVRRDGAADSHTMTAWINNVLDATINTVSIIATADVTWEMKTITFGSTIAADDVINLQSDCVVDNNEVIFMKASSFVYNR